MIEHVTGNPKVWVVRLISTLVIVTALSAAAASAQGDPLALNEKE